jgi:hypothetical protein
MNKSLTHDTLVTSLNTIDLAASRDQGGRPLALEKPFRDQLVRELEHCLIDADRLDPYLGALQAALEGRARYAEPLEGDDLAKVLRNGLSALDDGALVRLALNPIALWQLYDRLLSSRPSEDHWAYLMCEAELEARGLPPWSEWEKAIGSVPLPGVAASPPLVHDGRPEAISSVVEQFAGVAERAWRYLVDLALCRPAVRQAWGTLAHDQAAPEAEGGKEVPLPAALREQLPWLSRLQIIVTGPGRKGADTRRYRVEAEVAEDVDNLSGALRVALLQENGTANEKDVTITATDRLAPFKTDFSSDWSKLKVGLDWR